MNSTRKRITVRDVMKTRFGFIDGMATIQDALIMMKGYKTSMLVVKKRHENDEFGILLASDIARMVLAKDRACQRVNVYEVMEKPAVYIHPDMDIRYCSRLFAQFSLMRALVVEKGKVLGTISPNALVLDGMFSLVAESITEDPNSDAN
jgi:predicted transcriptional regulator